MSVRGAWQLPQLRFARIEIDWLVQEIGSSKFAGAAAVRSSPPCGHGFPSPFETSRSFSHFVLYKCE
jgi:hypothetical protein